MTRRFALASLIVPFAVLGSGCGRAYAPADDGGAIRFASRAGFERAAIRGSAGQPLRNGGAIDVRATVDALAEAGVTSHAYLIHSYKGLVDASRHPAWDALPEFLEEAAAKGIDVWVYLSGPGPVVRDATGCVGRSLPPYQLDYVAWARAIASLSLRHRNLKAFSIDDFGHRLSFAATVPCDEYSVADVRRVSAAAKAIAPALQFWPVLYYPDLKGRMDKLSPLRPFVDGVVFPFRDDPSRNTSVTASAPRHFDVFAKHLSCKRGEGTGGRGNDGCAQIYFPRYTRSRDGDYGGTSQVVLVDGRERPTLTFSWRHDHAFSPELRRSAAGHVFAQIVVDHRVVWERDIVSVPHYEWQTVRLDLRDALHGKTRAPLQIRVTHKQGVANFGHSIWFDELKTTGLRLENGGFDAGSRGWNAARRNDAFDVQTVRTQPFVAMFYASELKAPEGQAALTPPTGAYVAAVLAHAWSAIGRGAMAGTMALRLPLAAPDSDVFRAVRDRYRR